MSVKVIDSTEWDYWNKLDFSNLSIEQMHYYAKIFYELIKWKIYEVDDNNLFHLQYYSLNNIDFSLFSLNKIQKKFNFVIECTEGTDNANFIDKYAIHLFCKSIQFIIMILNEVCGIKLLKLNDVRDIIDDSSFASILSCLKNNLNNRQQKIKLIYDMMYYDNLKKEASSESYQPTSMNIVTPRYYTYESISISQWEQTTVWNDLTRIEKDSIVNYDRLVENMIFGMLEVVKDLKIKEYRSNLSFEDEQYYVAKLGPGAYEFIKHASIFEIDIPAWRETKNMYNEQSIFVNRIKNAWNSLNRKE